MTSQNEKYRLIADLLELDQAYHHYLHKECWQLARFAADKMAHTCRQLELLSMSDEDGTVKPTEEQKPK